MHHQLRFLCCAALFANRLAVSSIQTHTHVPAERLTEPAHQQRSGSPRAVRSSSFRHRFQRTPDMSTRGEMTGCPVKSARMLTAILVVLLFTPQSGLQPKRPNAGNSHGYSQLPAAQARHSAATS
jgi:hypothetical protein